MGIRPAVNPGISVSRVGGSAQIKAMKKVSGQLKLAYSQYRELQAFAQFGSDLDADTRQRLMQGERIVEVLKQDRNAPLDVEKQVALIYAVVNGMLDSIDCAKIGEFKERLCAYLDAGGADVLAAIRDTGTLSEENEKKLHDLIAEFKDIFVNG